ncbi:MAG TPA: ABC transporter substrate-binding protein [Chloroflexota bacterium]|nr:ABC transporter substrate-binding protein [Chloroflexota bacterium]
MVRRTGAGLALAALAALLLAACSASGSAPSAAKPAGAPAGGGAPAAAPAQRTNVRVALAVPNYGGYSAVEVGKDRGFYERYGIDVRITAYNGGGPAQEAVTAGEEDVIHYFPPGVGLAVGKGVKEKIVATDSPRPAGWYLGVAASSPIQSVSDLNGKRIGVTSKGSTTDFYALWIGKRAGINVEPIPVGAPAILPSLTSGNVDAAILNPPLPFKAFASGEARPLMNLAEEMPPNLPSVVVATDQIIEQHPEAVTAYLKGLFEAIRYMKQNRDYAIDFLMNYTKQDRATEEQDYDQVIMKLSDDGHIEREWLQNSLDLGTQGSGLTFPPIEQIYTDRFTPVKLD